MASEIILRDSNFVPVLAGVTDDINLEIRMLRVNPSNGRLLVSSDASGSGQSAIQFQDEGSNLGTAGTVDTLNFVGAGVVATRVSNVVTITVGGGGGSGTVTSVSVVTANGVSGSVATATTTPAITLTLGAITPTTVVASGSITTGNSIIMEDPGAGTQAIALHAPSGLVTGYTLTLPANDGNTNDVIISNGTGTLSFVALSSLIQPGGGAGDIQFNNAPDFAGSSNLNWNNGTQVLTMLGTIDVTGLGGARAGLFHSDNPQVVIVDGNSLTGISLTSGGVSGGFVGMIENDNSSFIASYTANDTALGGIWYMFANRHIGYNVVDGLTVLGDIDGNNNFTKLTVDDENTVVISTNAVATPTMIADQSGSPTSTINNGIRGVYIDPPSVMTTLDITLPSAPVDGQEVVILFGGVIASGNITSGALTILPNSGQIIIGQDTSSKSTTNTICIYKYRASNTAWYSMSTF